MSSDLFQSQRVRLTAVNKDDSPVISEWHRDSEFLRLFDALPAYPKDRATVEKWIEKQNDDKDVFFFGIRLLENDALIGFLELDGILWADQTCWFSIAIGDRSNQGKGYGEEATRLALNYAFNELNMHRIQLTVFSYNQRAVALYERLGFKREGIHREQILRDGKRYDMYLYGLLRHEWVKKVN